MTILFVLDFEANCIKDKILYPQEIIEIPVIAYDTFTDKIIGQFHQYCKPYKQITPFCTELTGITQGMVNAGDSFELALKSLEKWIFDIIGEITNERVNENPPQNKQIEYLFVTCGDWDLKTALVKQCKYLAMPVPKTMSEWCNIKTIFKEIIRKNPGGMMSMLKILGIKHTGRHHSGIDDVRNIVEIARELTRRKCNWRITGKNI
jgi:ERI1 exoribonuclease 3